MNTFGQLPILASVLWANRIMCMFASEVFAWNALMSAPAEKNFSRADRMTTTLTESFWIIASTAASRSSMNERS